MRIPAHLEPELRKMPRRARRLFMQGRVSEAKRVKAQPAPEPEKKPAPQKAAQPPQGKAKPGDDGGDGRKSARA